MSTPIKRKLKAQKYYRKDRTRCLFPIYPQNV